MEYEQYLHILSYKLLYYTKIWFYKNQEIKKTITSKPGPSTTMVQIYNKSFLAFLCYIL